MSVITAMKPAYRSTRNGEGVSFEEALLRGLAPDGGLYIPSATPTVNFQRVFRQESFADLAFETLQYWLTDEIEPVALRSIIDDALDFAVPLVPLDGLSGQNVHVLELFHGPTLSFKDFGARTMARCMGYFLQERQERLTILVATSGDTGSAVADGFAGLEGIDVVLLYPKGQVSPVQERQLIVSRPGVRAFAVEGDFDDCQRMVKEAFVDDRLRAVGLSSANSINIGRLLPQMLYYAWAVRELGSERVLFCVPSGNLGNLTGGVLAHLSGLPVGGFLAAHNENDFFPRYLSNEPAAFQPTVQTLSNAMDVGAPSNFERLESLLEPRRLRSLVHGISVTDEETIASIARVQRETGYLADPHTAVGLDAIRKASPKGDEPVVVLSTAHPAKFPETMKQAVGIEPEPPPRLANLWELETEAAPLEASIAALRSVLTAGTQ